MPTAKKRKLQCDRMNQIRHGRAPSVAVQTIVTKKIDRGIQIQSKFMSQIDKLIV